MTSTLLYDPQALEKIAQDFAVYYAANDWTWSETLDGPHYVPTAAQIYAHLIERITLLAHFPQLSMISTARIILLRHQDGSIKIILLSEPGKAAACTLLHKEPTLGASA